MSDLDLKIATTYTSNLPDMLTKNESLLAAHVNKVNALNLKLKVEYDLDAGNIKKQIDDLYQKIQSIAASQAKPAVTTPGAGMLGGVLSGTQKQAAELQGLLERTSRMTKTKAGEINTITDKTYDPTSKSITRTTRNEATGDILSQVSSQKDRENALKALLSDDKYSGLNKQINQAEGLGDKGKQIELLKERKSILDQIAAKYQDIAASPAYRQLVSGSERTQRKIDTLEGGVVAAQEKQKQRELEAKRKREEREAKEAFKTTQALEKQRQSEVGKLAKFDKDAAINDERQTKAIDEVDYKKARQGLKDSRATVTNATELANINQRIAALDAARVQSLERSAAVYRDMAEQAKKVGDYSLAGRSTTLADNFTREARRTEAGIGGEKNKRYVEETRRSMEQELVVAKQRLATELQVLETKQKQARASRDQAALQKSLNDKATALKGFSAVAGDIGDRAGLRGFDTLSKNAKNSSFNSGLDAKKAVDASNLAKAADAANRAKVANDQLGDSVKKTGEKAKSSGNNFGSIAFTFLRWNVAARLVTGSLQSVFALLEGATRVDRQFSVLRSIFRGTAEEAQQLKRDTLDLAVANGRSADEALSAATGFARLGLTRTQINKLVQTSLVSANVAEIDSAQAAEKLTALMQQYKLSVDEVGQALNRLNSISNTNNVTVSQLLNNIALMASVARQAGIALEDLEGITGTTIAATKATSSEIGNAIKFVLQRIRKPENIEALKLEFDLDLTKANGDLREGTEIIAELARIYPLLSKQEQTRLLDLAAGTRQASRFAAVLENFNKAQLTTANAIGDTNSAMRENEAITQSLASQMQSLETAWTSFGVAIGDSGFLDFLAEKVADLRDVVDDAVDLLNGGGKGETDRDGNKRNIKVANNKDRDALDFLADTRDGATVINRKAFSEKELQDFQKAIPIIEKYQNALIDIDTSNVSSKDRFDGRDMALNQLRRELQPLGFKNVTSQQAAYLERNFSGSEMSQAEAFLEKQLPDAKNKKDNAQLTALRGRVEQFTRGEKTARSIASQIQEQAAAGVADPRTIASDFEALREVTRELPNGSNLFAASLEKVNAALAKGDYKAVAKEYLTIADAFSAASPEAKTSFADLQAKKVQELNQELDLATQRKNELLVTPGASADEITTANDKVKELQASLAEAQRTAASIKIEVVNPEDSAGIVKAVENRQERVKGIVSALAENKGGEQTETARLKLARNSSLNRVGVFNAQKQYADTKAEAERQLSYLVKGSDEYNRQKQIQDYIVDKAKRRLATEYETAQILDQQNRNEFQGNRIKEGIKKGEADFSIGEAGYGAGLNEAEKLQSKISGDFDQIKKASEQLRDLGQDADPALRQRPIATILSAQESSQKKLIDLRMRELQIGVEQQQNAIDLSKAEKERTQEVSKRLSLASREEQLISAFLQASINKGGALSQDEFLGLSQRNRTIADQFLQKGGNPFSGDETPQGKFDKKEEELQIELETARDAIARFSSAISANQALIEQGSVVGGPFADRGVGPGNKSLQGSNSPVSNGQIILNAQGTVFNIDIAKSVAQLQQVFTAQIDQRISGVMAQVANEIRANIPRDPDIVPSSSAVGVQ